MVVRAGSTGRERALEHPLYGVPPHRGLFPTIPPRADPLVCPALPSAGPTPADQATRQAKWRRTNASVAEASGGDAGAGAAAIRARAAACGVTWHAQAPEAVAHCASDWEQTRSSCAVHVPQSSVSLLRTTHLLERLQKDMRPKQRDSGMLHSAQGGDVLWY